MSSQQNLYGCNFYCLNILLFRQNLGENMTKSEIIFLICDDSCVFEINFWWNGFTSNLFPTYMKMGSLLTFSYDCASINNFQKLFLVNFWSVFADHVIVNISIIAWNCWVKIPNSLNLIFPWRTWHTDSILFFHFIQPNDHFLTIPQFETSWQICASFYWTCL